jgi:hypothetical protein
LTHQGQDQRIFERLIRFLDKKKASAASPERLILDIGRFFLGTPYVVGPLETEGAERLVVSLRGFDCTTFAETVVALACLAKSRKRSFVAFRSILRKVRYRQGRLQGYPSRLHYFSDWIHDNQKKGIVRNITGEAGGRPLKKTMSFMTKRPDLYPPLRDPAVLRKIKSVEKAINRRSFFFISKKMLERVEDRIHDGDLVGITTNIDGLDVQHVGFAARVKNRIHLLHASRLEGKVALSRLTLNRYLMQNRTGTGIMVARICKMHRA